MPPLTQNRNYHLLFVGSAGSNLGDGIALLAFPWLATLISRDPVHIAMVAMAARLPWFLFSLPAGVLIDRSDRQSLLVGSDSLRTLLSLAVVFFVLALPELPTTTPDPLFLVVILCCISFLLGAAEVQRDNAAQTVLPMLVNSADLEKANGQLWSIEQVMGSFVGPPLAGFLIAWSLPTAFGVNAALFVFSALCLWYIRFPVITAQSNSSSFISEMRAGIDWIRGSRTILQLAVMLGLLNLFATMALTILVLFSQEVLLLTAVGHGFLLTAVAAGGVIGGLVCPWLVAKWGGRSCLYVALATFPLPYLFIFLVDSPVLVAIALFVEILASMLWNTVTVSYRQRVIPAHFLGRVNSIYRFFGWGMMPVGAVAGGLVVALAEPLYGRQFALALPYLVAALGCLLVFLYALWALEYSD